MSLSELIARDRCALIANNPELAAMMRSRIDVPSQHCLRLKRDSWEIRGRAQLTGKSPKINKINKIIKNNKKRKHQPLHPETLSWLHDGRVRIGKSLAHQIRYISFNVF